MTDVSPLPDLTTVTAYAGVAGTILATVYFAMQKTLKKLRSEETAPPGAMAQKIVGGMIMDNTTLLMWSESNRDVVDALNDHTKEMMELRFAMSRLADRIGK